MDVHDPRFYSLDTRRCYIVSLEGEDSDGAQQQDLRQSAYLTPCSVKESLFEAPEDQTRVERALQAAARHANFEEFRPGELEEEREAFQNFLTELLGRGMHTEAEAFERQVQKLTRRYEIETKLAPGTEYYDHLRTHRVVPSNPRIQEQQLHRGGASRSSSLPEVPGSILGFDLSGIYDEADAQSFKRMLVEALCLSVTFGERGVCREKNNALAQKVAFLLLRECNKQQHFFDAMCRVQVLVDAEEFSPISIAIPQPRHSRPEWVELLNRVLRGTSMGGEGDPGVPGAGGSLVSQLAAVMQIPLPPRGLRFMLEASEKWITMSNPEEIREAEGVIGVLAALERELRHSGGGGTKPSGGGGAATLPHGLMILGDCTFQLEKEAESAPGGPGGGGVSGLPPPDKELRRRRDLQDLLRQVEMHRVVLAFIDSEWHSFVASMAMPDFEEKRKLTELFQACFNLLCGMLDGNPTNQAALLPYLGLLSDTLSQAPTQACIGQNRVLAAVMQDNEFNAMQVRPRLVQAVVAQLSHREQHWWAWSSGPLRFLSSITTCRGRPLYRNQMMVLSELLRCLQSKEVTQWGVIVGNGNALGEDFVFQSDAELLLRRLLEHSEGHGSSWRTGWVEAEEALMAKHEPDLDATEAALLDVLQGDGGGGDPGDPGAVLHATEADLNRLLATLEEDPHHSSYMLARAHRGLARLDTTRVQLARLDPTRVQHASLKLTSTASERLEREAYAHLQRAEAMDREMSASLVGKMGHLSEVRGILCSLVPMLEKWAVSALPSETPGVASAGQNVEENRFWQDALVGIENRVGVNPLHASEEEARCPPRPEDLVFRMNRAMSAFEVQAAEYSRYTEKANLSAASRVVQELQALALAAGLGGGAGEQATGASQPLLTRHATVGADAWLRVKHHHLPGEDASSRQAPHSEPRRASALQRANSVEMLRSSVSQLSRTHSDITTHGDQGTGRDRASSDLDTTINGDGGGLRTSRDEIPPRAVGGGEEARTSTTPESVCDAVKSLYRHCADFMHLHLANGSAFDLGKTWEAVRAASRLALEGLEALEQEAEAKWREQRPAQSFPRTNRVMAGKKKGRRGRFGMRWRDLESRLELMSHTVTGPSMTLLNMSVYDNNGLNRVPHRNRAAQRPGREHRSIFAPADPRVSRRVARPLGTVLFGLPLRDIQRTAEDGCE